MNSEEAAKARGIKVFDTALPQDWVDDFVASTGFNPVGRMVWSYDKATVFGAAEPLDDEATAALQRFEATRGR